MSTRFASHLGSRARRSVGAWGLLLGLSGLASLAACADPVIVDQVPDGGTRVDMQVDGGTSPTGLWTATPSLGAALISEGPMVDARRRFKRDPHYIKDGTGTQYLYISGSDYATESWSVSYFTQASGTLTNTSTWTAGVVGTSGTWYSGDVTGPAVRSAADRTLYFAANTSPTDQNRTRPDYVFQIGRATLAGTAYQATTTPALAVPTFTGTGAGDTPTTARPDAYGAMDPFIVEDTSANPTMYYTGLDCAAGTCKFQILRTVSTDGGLTFPAGTVVLSGRANNPEEAGGVAAPSVVVRSGEYLLAYTAVKTPPGKSRAEIRTALTTGSIDLAMSTDGITFKPVSATSPIISRSVTYRESGATSPSLYLDATNALHAYFAGYQMSGGSESFNIATADFQKSQ